MKYGYTYNAETNFLTLFSASGDYIMDIPLSARIVYSGKEIYFSSPVAEQNGKRITVTSRVDDGIIGEVRMILDMHDDDIQIVMEADAEGDFAPHEVELFRIGKLGIKMIDCLEWFAPQPMNFDGINRAFNKRFCDLSLSGYFTPAPLNFTVGNKKGLVSFGLLDLPDSYEYRMTVRLGVIVEHPAGKKVISAGGVYRTPRMILTFPADEYQGISLYREKLCEYGIIDAKKKPIERPDWWQRPIAVTYGDEMMLIQHNWFNDDDLDSDAFSEEWLYDWLDRTERRMGNIKFNIIIDALWQYRYTPEAYYDKERFPGFRRFIEYCHERDHKVILWTAPFICTDTLPIKSLAEKYGMLTNEYIRENAARKIDFSSDNAPLYFAELCEKYFGDGEGCLNCDGVKLDFLASLHRPDFSEYANADNGIGFREIYRFHELFAKAARAVKPDVLINASACDPRFEDHVSMNRLHDIQKVYSEREIRARISSLACPDLLIDSDGAIMISDWVFATYVSAVVYSAPSLYYIDRFHDSVSFTDEQMNALGSLLSLAGKKPYGRPEFISLGNWRSITDGRVYAASFDGKCVEVFSTDAKAYIFSTEGGTLEIPFFDRKLAREYSFAKIDGDNIVLNIEPMKVYELDVM